MRDAKCDDRSKVLQCLECCFEVEVGGSDRDGADGELYNGLRL